MNYECFVQPRGFARWVCAAVLAAGAVRGATPTARDYVQTGLVAHWDGLENAGYGQHDGAATVWKDLAGSRDLALTAKGSWSAAALQVAGGIAATNRAAYGTYKTIEVVYQSETTADMQIVFDSGAKYRFLIHNVLHEATQFSYGGPCAPIDKSHAQDARAVAAVFDSTASSDNPEATYLDGASSEMSYAENWNTLNYMAVGGGSNTGRPFTGKVYAIRLYDRKLSAAEIARNNRFDRERFFGEAPVFTHVWTGAAGTTRWSDAGNWTDAAGASVASAPDIASSVCLSNTSAQTTLTVALPVETRDVIRLVAGGAGTVRLARTGGTPYVRARLTAVDVILGGTPALAVADGVSLETTYLQAGADAPARGVYTGNGPSGTSCAWLAESGTVSTGAGSVPPYVVEGFYTTLDYAQEGLSAMWDGLENAGRGVHDASASAWRDLAGANPLTLVAANAYWGTHYFYCPGGIAATGTKNGTYRTIEIVYRSAVATGIGVVFDSGVTGRIVVHNVEKGKNYVAAGEAGLIQFNAINTTSFSSACTPFTNATADVQAAATFASTSSETGPEATYFDGSPARAVYDESWGSRGELTLGQASNAGRKFSGRIYAIRLYERALTADEIRRNARVDRVRFFGAPLPNLGTSIFIR